MGSCGSLALSCHEPMPESEPFVKSLALEDRSFLTSTLKQTEEDVVEVLTTLKQDRIDLIEVCCGPNSLLGETVVSQAGKAERIGLFNGFDMSTKQGYEKARKFIARRNPRWLWFSLPCGPTSPIQNLTDELTPEGLTKSLKRKQKSRRTCKNCVALGKEHVERNGDLGWEWPRGNQAWNFPEVKWFLEFLESRDLYFPAKLDGCMVGVIAPDCGVPMKKPWLIVSTNRDMSMRLGIRCSGQHEHVECLGHDRAAHSAFYPPKMCKMITRVVLSSRNIQPVVFGVDDVPTKDKFGNISPESLKHMKEAIHKLHVRSGHPSNQALVNCLRARGVSRVVLALAKEHTCDSCQEVRLLKPHTHVSMSKSEVLWRTMQMDFGQVRVGDEVVHVLFMVCEASRFMNVCEVFRHHHTKSRIATTEEVIKAIETFWVQYHGYPSVLKHDPEGAFRGHNFILRVKNEGLN